MHFTRFTTVLLSASLASAAAVHRRIISVDTIVQDVYNIHNAVLANRAATEAYQGGNLLTSLIEGTPVLVTVAAINLVNRKGFVDATLAPHFNEEDTRQIFNTVVDTVGASIPDSVQVLIEKKSAFESSGMGSVVLASLELLLDDHDTFSAAVEEKSFMGDAKLTAEGVAVVTKIHDAIQDGISAYSA